MNQSNLTNSPLAMLLQRTMFQIFFSPYSYINLTVVQRQRNFVIFYWQVQQKVDKRVVASNPTGLPSLTSISRFHCWMNRERLHLSYMSWTIDMTIPWVTIPYKKKLGNWTTDWINNVIVNVDILYQKRTMHI